MRMLDLFAGRFGWGKSFAARGWEVVGIDLVAPPEIPEGCSFLQADILKLGYLPGEGFVLADSDMASIGYFDFVCASSPCEQFSVHGMGHFHPNPPYPELGIRLFNHARALCEAAEVPYVMENVRAAEKFLGHAQHHCGSFYLWGNAVPPIMPQVIKKGMRLGTGGSEGCGVPGNKRFRDMTPEQKRAVRKTDPMISAASVSEARKMATAAVATIAPELSACVADYAERIIEQKLALA